MTCTGCGRDLQDFDRYCPWCGTPQPAATGVPGPPVSDPGTPDASGAGSSGEEVRQLRAAVSRMSVELARLSMRLETLEREGASTSAPRQPAQQIQPVAAPGPQQSVAPGQPPADTHAVSPAPATSPTPPVPAGQPVASGGTAGTGRYGIGADLIPSWNWEWLLGGNWLARIGIVALVFGVAFLISLAIDNGWLGETERVILGLAGGGVLLGAGEYWRRRYAVWAQTVTGGGLAILYLSVYGAFALYDLIPSQVAFGAFVLITVAGAAASLRHDAVGVAVLSVFGGFATPILLQDRLPDQRILLAYVLLLDVGVLLLVAIRNWRWFTLLAWAGSLILFAFWHQELDPSVALAQVGITAIFLVFAGATIVFDLLRRQSAGIVGLALVTLNAAGYYGISYWLMNDLFRPWMGGFTIALAAFYVLLGVSCRLRGPEQHNLTLFSAGLAVVFAVIAVPIQFDGTWIAMAWAVEAVALVWLSFLVGIREVRWFGYVTFGVFAGWLLAADSPTAIRAELTPFLNWYMLSSAVGALSAALSYWLLWRHRDRLEPFEQAGFPAFAVAAAVAIAVAIPAQLQGVWVTIAWALESLLVLELSQRLRIAVLRWSAYALLAAMLVRLLAVDTLDIDPETFRPVANWRFLSFTIAIAALYWSAWRSYVGNLQAFHIEAETERNVAVATALVLANLVTLWLLSAEIMASAESALFGLSGDVSENVSSLGLSLLWAVYAAILIVLGVARRWRWVRVAGLALLAAPVVKLFAFDSRLLEQEFRVIAFLALGLILLAGGLIYQRYSRVVRGFLFD